MRNLIASTFVAAALIAAPAGATTAEVAVKVNVADLDLSKPDHAAKFERRLSDKVRAACTFDRPLNGGKELDRKCYAEAKRAVKVSLAQRGQQLAVANAAE